MTTIKDFKKAKKISAKAIATRKKNEAEKQKKNEVSSKKRAKTIKESKKSDIKKQARKERRRKFNQFTSKPIVWVFALVGWGHVVYYLFQLVIIVLKTLGYM